MAMNLTEKIIAKHANLKSVVPGQIVEVAVDWCMVNDATASLGIDIFANKFGFDKVFDPGKVVFVMDHQIPADSVNTSEGLKRARQFAREQGILFHEGDGVCHQVMFEKYVKPGQLVIAADSHTCSYGAIAVVSSGMGSTDVSAAMGSGMTWLKVPETIKFNLTGSLKKGVYAKDVILYIIGQIGSAGATYKTMEFEGDFIESISISDRFTICNMAVEAGAKSSMIAPDAKTRALFAEDDVDWLFFAVDADAAYEKVVDIDVSSLTPQLSCPHFVDNVCPVSEKTGIKIDQAFIGSCTNGRIDDLRIAAEIMRGKKAASAVRVLVTPASTAVYKQALKEGLIDVFLDAGAIINHPSCSTCWGACQGILAGGEVMISSANRNFKGRAGSPQADIYLASPATVAASALSGTISSAADL